MAAVTLSPTDDRPYPWYEFSIYLAITVSILVWWIVSKSRWKGYHPIMLHARRPSPAEVDEFLGDFAGRRDEVGGLSAAGWSLEASLARLERLRAIGELTQDEYDDLVLRTQRRAEADTADDEYPGQYL